MASIPNTFRFMTSPSRRDIDALLKGLRQETYVGLDGTGSRFQVPGSRFWFGFQVRVPGSGSRFRSPRENLEPAPGTSNQNVEPEPGTRTRTLNPERWNLEPWPAVLLREQYNRTAGIGNVDIGRIQPDLGSSVAEILSVREARVDGPVPCKRRPERRQLYPLTLEVRVEDDEQPPDREAAGTALELDAQRPRFGVVPAGVAQVGPVPFEVRHAVVVQVGAERELTALQHGEPAYERDDLLEEVNQFVVAGHRVPVEPADRVVLAVGVVVALLRAAEFVAAQKHRRAR